MVCLNPFCQIHPQRLQTVVVVGLVVLVLLLVALVLVVLRLVLLQWLQPDS